MILHHNVDKLLLVGGNSEPAFNGGKITKPIELFFAGRATQNFHGKKVPLLDIIHSSLDELLQSYYGVLKKENFNVHNYIRPGSADLVELFERGYASGDFFSNDTSCGVGYAPLSPLEKAALKTEQYLNSPQGKKEHPEAGEDIKIMALRQGERVTFTAGVAFVDRHLKDIDDYIQKKEKLEEKIRQMNQALFSEFEIKVNTADNYKNKSIFMTVTGTSAESGDDGEVGRGNRANGLISPYYPMTMEAISGKNPVTHTGKLYNWIAMEIAEAISQVDEVKKCHCYLVSRIGNPVSKPHYTDIKLETADGKLSDANRKRITEIVEEKLFSLKTFGQRIVKENLLLVK